MKRARKASAAKSVVDADDDPFAPVVEAFAHDREVSRGKMFGSAGLRVNGKVFAMCVKGKFVAKLPQERVASLVASGAGEYFDPGHGRRMREWVAIESERSRWVDLARDARAFVKEGRP